MARAEDSAQAGHAVVHEIGPRGRVLFMTRALTLAALAVALAAVPATAQLNIPEISYDAVDPLKLPDDLYLGQGKHLRLHADW